MKSILSALGSATLLLASASTAALATDHHAAAETVSEEAAVQAAVDGVYDVISGGVGEARDWDRMRGMFMPRAVMGAVGGGPDGNGRGRLITVEEYIERSGPFLLQNGFTEVATHTEIRMYGELAYVRSAYEGTNSATGEIIVTGVNFMTLFKIEGEWKFASLLWRQADETWPPGRAFE